MPGLYRHNIPAVSGDLPALNSLARVYGGPGRDARGLAVELVLDWRIAHGTPATSPFAANERLNVFLSRPFFRSQGGEFTVDQVGRMLSEGVREWWRRRSANGFHPPAATERYIHDGIRVSAATARRIRLKALDAGDDPEREMGRLLRLALPRIGSAPRLDTPEVAHALVDEATWAQYNAAWAEYHRVGIDVDVLLALKIDSLLTTAAAQAAEGKG